MIEAFIVWTARTVGESPMLIASLSATHLIGFTLVMGGAFIANLRMMGVLLPQYSIVEVTRPASRAIALGLAISIATGLLLFSWRAAEVLANSIFQLKMVLLMAATVFHYTWHRSVAQRNVPSPRLLRITGAFGFSLWLGLALAGCAFILIE